MISAKRVSAGFRWTAMEPQYFCFYSSSQPCSQLYSEMRQDKIVIHSLCNDCVLFTSSPHRKCIQMLRGDFVSFFFRAIGTGQRRESRHAPGVGPNPSGTQQLIEDLFRTMWRTTKKIEQDRNRLNLPPKAPSKCPCGRKSSATINSEDWRKSLKPLMYHQQESCLFQTEAICVQWKLYKLYERWIPNQKQDVSRLCKSSVY